VASSPALRACIKAWGGGGTLIKRPSEGFSGMQAHDPFDVAYPNGTTFSVAVEPTPAAAQRLQALAQGVLVDESVSDEAPDEMKDAAAETVHRVGNVVVIYRNPQHLDDAGVVRCLTQAR